MKPIHALPIILLCFSAQGVWSAEPLNFEDETTRISYSLGHQIGSDFRRQGVAIDPAIVARGAEDALTGAEPLMTSAEIDQELRELFAAVGSAGRT